MLLCQDIDKELELLQRKREIIEQQQQILSNEFRVRATIYIYSQLAIGLKNPIFLCANVSNTKTNSYKVDVLTITFLSK